MYIFFIIFPIMAFVLIGSIAGALMSVDTTK